MLRTGGVKSPRQLSASRSAKRFGTIIEESIQNKGCTFRPYAENSEKTYTGGAAISKAES